MSGSASVRSRVADHLLEIPRSGIRDFFDIVSTRKGVISLGIGEPDFVTPWRIREASQYALDRGRTSYTSNRGLLKLRQAIALYLERVFGVSYDPETEILITVGVSEALDLAVRAVCNPGDEFLYHEPCYVSYPAVVRFAHGIPVAVATRWQEEFRLTRAMVEPHVTARTRALLLNFPTNPTGAVLTREELEGIAALARERDLLVISDEIYAELTYEGMPQTIAALPGMKERTLFLHGFSKGWAMTGFRLGYACGSADLIEAMMKIHQYTMLCASIISQEAAVEALRSDEDTHRMRDAYARRRDYIVSELNGMGFPCVLPRGAFYAFPSIGSSGLSSREFALKLLDEENVACVPGSAFGAAGEGHLRCAYAASMDDIQEAMVRLRRFAERQSASRR